VSSEYAAALWSAIWQSGQPDGLVAAGYRAIESLRLEKGYRVWGSDITPETNPYEAGIGFCVKLDKAGGFEGHDALQDAKQRGVTRRLRALVLDDPQAVVLGSEPVRVGSQVVGRVTSGGYGYTIGASIAYAYLPIEHAGPGTRIAVDLFGEWVEGAVAAREPLFDPTGERVRPKEAAH
jgi:glycine cleavage system aminomethyltransferase T